MRVDDICSFLEEAAPIERAMEYDNVGLLVGKREASVDKVMTALDLTEEVLYEAYENECGMVVMHHPIMFKKVGKITDETAEGRAIIFAIEHNIAIYAAHTNLDFADGGLNDYFLEKLGLRPAGALKDNEGRHARAELFGEELVKNIGKVFDLQAVRTTLKGGEKISDIALCTGSGKSLIDDVKDRYDVYITGELGHHDVQRLKEGGCEYIEISHYDSEKIVKELLKNKLKTKFGDTLEVIESREDRDIMHIIIF